MTASSSFLSNILWVVGFKSTGSVKPPYKNAFECPYSGYKPCNGSWFFLRVKVTLLHDLDPIPLSHVTGHSHCIFPAPATFLTVPLTGAGRGHLILCLCSSSFLSGILSSSCRQSFSPLPSPQFFTQMLPFFFFLSFIFLEPHLQHMEFPRLGV